MLEIKKLEKMIREYLKNLSPSQEEVEQFKTLMLAYKSCEESITNTPVKLTPPKIINIQKVKNVFIVKDESMCNCISEMLSNPLFIRMAEVCA